MFIEVQAWLFVLMAVGYEPSNEMHHKIGGTTMTRMLDLRDVLELVNDELNDAGIRCSQLHT